MAIILLIFVIILVLQTYLSLRENDTLGLILPALCLAVSLFITVGATMYTMDGGAPFVVSILTMMLPLNIPTIWLFVVYRLCRKSVNQNRKQEAETSAVSDDLDAFEDFEELDEQ